MVAVPCELSPASVTDDDSDATQPLPDEPWDFSDGFISFKVRELQGDDGFKTTSIVCPANVTFGEFVNEVALKTNTSPGDYDILYQRTNGEDCNIAEESKDLCFSTLNIVPRASKEYNIQMQRRRVKRKVVRRLEVDFEAVSSQSQNSQSSDSTQPLPPDDDAVETVDVEVSKDFSCSLPDYFSKEFVGLRNQFTTCYLNSLLQSLFFAPEFRNMIYNSVFEYDPKMKSIGLALQRLFLLLQFSVRNSVDTTEITNTFGWKDGENAVQHDVEECFRVITDLLGDEFRKSGRSVLSESLFGGVWNDYVECLSCHQRNSKREMFTAMPLAVRSYGKPLSQPTLEEALRTFVQAELLNEGNQYKCERCDCLVDAHKGLCFQQLPYLMCIHLKRFEFDFELMTKKKISDKLAFPLILNMNEFMSSSNEDTDSSNLIPPFDMNVMQGPTIENRPTHSRPKVSLKQDGSSKSNGTSEDSACSANGDSSVSSFQLPADLQELAQSALKDGNNVYQLLSVLIHRGGSSIAGHYYAYVLDLEKHQWYKCNDSSVFKISQADIADSYGGINPFGRSDESDGTAYMLVYRRFDSKLNTLPLLECQLPPHIKEMWKALAVEDLNLSQEEEFERSIMRIPVYYRPLDIWDPMKKVIVIERGLTMAEACEKCYQTFFPGYSSADQEIRLTRFHEGLQIMDMSFDVEGTTPFGDAYRKPISSEQNDALMLELKVRGYPLEPYDPTDFVYKTYLVDLDTHNFISMSEIHGKPGSKVSELKDKLALRLGLKNGFVGVIARDKTGTHIYSNDNMSLSSSTLTKFTELFVACLPTEDIMPLYHFVNNNYKSYIVEIECQLTSPSYTDSPACQEDMDVGMYAEVVLNEVNGKNHAHYEFPEVSEDLQYKFNEDPDEAFNNFDLNEESVELEKATSDQSEDSSTASTTSERTLIGDDPSSPNRNHDEMVVESEYQEVPYEEVNGSSSPYYFRVLEQRRSDDGEWKLFKARIQMDTPFDVISKRISKLISTEESEFILYTMSEGLESEVLIGSDTLKSVQPLDCIRTRIGHRLGKNEARVGVFLLDIANYQEKPTYLTDVIVQDDMTIENLRQLVQLELSLLTDFDKQRLTHFRLRKKIHNTPSRIMHDDMNFTDYFPRMKGDIFVQPLSGPDECKEHGHHPFVVRHWHPKVLTLDPPVEFVLFYDYVVSLEELVRDKVISLFGIEPGNLEVANPETDYPFELNPIEIHEKLTWYDLCTGKRRHISIHNDEGVLFVRDKLEPLQYIHSDQRRVFEKECAKRRGEFVVTPRKSEIGFSVNLARTPPK